MTNNNTAAAIAAEIIATAETRIELRAAELHDVDCFRKLCASAVAWLDAEYFGQADDDEEHADEYRDPLSFEVYRNGHTGEYIADLDLAVGGPTIRNDMTGREDFAEICFSYLEACVIARARKERSE